MTKILVLYYSSYGHTGKMAEAVAEGVRKGGAKADILRVPETAPKDVAEAAGFKPDHSHVEIAGPDALRGYDGIIVGAPTRYGRMPSQMAAFWDQTGKLWQEGALIGKVGAAFTSTGTQHGGQEMTLFSILTNLMHMGMTVVGLDYGFKGQMKFDEVTGGAPFGATTIAGSDGSRLPSDNELAGARYLGERAAKLAVAVTGKVLTDA